MENGLVLVTGASSGIGEAIARHLHACGYRVMLTGRSEERLRKVHAELEGSAAYAADLLNTSEIAALFTFTEKFIEKNSLKGLYGLINNAGIFERKSFLEMDVDRWREMFETNLIVPVELARAFYPLLVRGVPSSILNISSTLGLQPVVETAAYSATKAAMVNWTKALALEWAEVNIRVNCICPGIVDTPIHGFHHEADTSPSRQAAHSMQPLKRMGKPIDIAYAAEFLISEKSAWTTGAVFSVDGGVGLT